jgi:hypothetical protein
MAVNRMNIFPEFYDLSAFWIGGNRNMTCCVEINTDPAGWLEYGWMKSDHLLSCEIQTAVHITRMLVKFWFSSSFLSSDYPAQNEYILWSECPD